MIPLEQLKHFHILRFFICLISGEENLSLPFWIISWDPCNKSRLTTEKQARLLACLPCIHMGGTQQMTDSPGSWAFRIKHHLSKDIDLFVVVYLLSCVPLFATQWTVAHQVPLSMELSRQEYWSGLLFPSAGDLPKPWIKPRCPALAGRFFTDEPPRKPFVVVVQLLNQVQLFATPRTTAGPASLSSTISLTLLKLMAIESVMLSNHLILCHPILLLPSIFLSIRVFSNKWALCIRWPKYWSISFSNRYSSEYSGLISFRIDWFDLLAVQGNLKSPEPHWLYGPLLAKGCLCFLTHCLGLSLPFFQGASIFWLQGFRHCLHWFWSPRKWNLTCFHISPIYLTWSDRTRCHDFGFLNAEFYASFFALLFHLHQEAL